MAILSYGESVGVQPDVETEILAYVVPAGRTLKLNGFAGTGGAMARFRVLVNGFPRLAYRTSHADRNAVIQLPTDEVVAAGSTVQISVTHFGSGPLGFEASLFGDLSA